VFSRLFGEKSALLFFVRSLVQNKSKTKFFSPQRRREIPELTISKPPKEKKQPD
jgi:hypothetical protein